VTAQQDKLTLAALAQRRAVHLRTLELNDQLRAQCRTYHDALIRNTLRLATPCLAMTLIAIWQRMDLPTWMGLGCLGYMAISGFKSLLTIERHLKEARKSDYSTYQALDTLEEEAQRIRSEYKAQLSVNVPCGTLADPPDSGEA